MEIVELGEGVADLLAAVVDRTSEDGAGPTNVIGLELVIPDAEKGRPALLSLNLERAEWPVRLSRPVIFWVPEFLLEILGREAPDFLDWRSDTVFFPQERLVGVEVMDSALWRGEHADRMSADARDKRIEELRSRLATTVDRDDGLALEARFRWLQELGHHLFYFGRLVEAEGAQVEAATIAERLGTWERAAESYLALGRIFHESGRHLEAEEWLDRTARIYETRGDRASLADAYYQLGTVAQLRGDLESAERWYRESLEILESLGDRLGMARSYHQLGVVAHNTGDLSLAERWYRESLKILESIGDRPGMAVSYHQFGRVAQDRGDLPSAEHWYRESLEIKESLGDRLGMARSYHQLGIVAQNRGDLSSAERWYRESLEIMESLGDPPSMALPIGQLGLLAEARGRKDEALEWMVRCVSLFPEFPHPSTGPGPELLARLTGELGFGALEAAWRKVAGEELPGEVRAWVEGWLAEAG